MRAANAFARDIHAGSWETGLAQGTIRARMMGDDFQSRLFWLHATMLFMPDRRVSHVRIESQECDAVDDLVIHYVPFREDGGTHYVREYISCKFHVSNATTYSSGALCDPKFFGTKQSFLARAYQAYLGLTKSGDTVAVTLASNGNWNPSDKLKTVISDGGALRESFFSATPRSDLGRIRLAWCQHLGVDESCAEPFLRSLRLEYGILNQRRLLESIDAHLQLVGLAPIDSAKAHNPYDAVYHELIKNGELDFDRAALTAVCEREGLGTPSQPPSESIRMAGIRSFMRGADYMDMECDPFLCLCDRFDGRAIRDPSVWNGEVKDALRKWCDALAASVENHELRLECHSSIAFAAGCWVGSRPRGRVMPAQGSKIGGSHVWLPGDSPPKAGWTSTDILLDSDGRNAAVALSITHDLSADVTRLLENRSDLGVSILRVYAPADGIGLGSIVDGAHAWALAEGITADVRALVDTTGVETLHLFTAAPNAFNYIMGRLRRPRDVVQTWEHNWDGSLTAEYATAIRID